MPFVRAVPPFFAHASYELSQVWPGGQTSYADRKTNVWFGIISSAEDRAFHPKSHLIDPSMIGPGNQGVDKFRK
jgi:hypothetical protein